MPIGSHSADETSDVVNQEQFNISGRWGGENFIVHEDPLGVVAVPDTTGDTLSSYQIESSNQELAWPSIRWHQ